MKIKSMKQIFVTMTTLLIFGTFGCAKKDSNSYDTSTADAIASSFAGASGAADNSGSVVAFNKVSGESKPLTVAFKDLITETMLIPKANAASCIGAVMVQGQSCTGSNMSLNLNGCTGLLGAVWTGTASLAFSSNGVCTNASTGGLANMGSGGAVTLSSSGGITRAGVGGYSVTVDSNPSGYSQNLSGGIQVTCNSADCSSSPGRSVNILGQHRALFDPTGAKIIDHTINTPLPLTITGFGASKVISSGSIQVQHNLAHFIAGATVTSPLTYANTSGPLCCHPTGGSVLVTYVSGNKSGSETITFGPGCGVASVNGNTFSLLYCQ